MESLIVVQHCQSEHHVNGLVGGWTDTPLTELGKRQAHHVAMRLQNHNCIEAFSLYSSEMLRAYETAQIIGDMLKKQITESRKLREMNLGSATGKTRKWFDKNHIPLPPHGKLDHRMLDDAETIREHFTRITRYLESLANQKVENAIIVTHGGAVPHIICWWLRIPLDLEDAFYMSGRPGGITVLTRNAHSGIQSLIASTT